MALVSCVLPYRDAEDTIAEAIESVLGQRGVDLELVAIDDGSSDASAQIVRAFAASDRRVRARSNEGRGLVAALELGWRSAAGAFIARMDADDVAHPDRFRLQLEALDASPEVAAMGTRVELTGDSIGDGMRRYVEWQNALVTPVDHARDLFVESPLCHPSVMMRRAALEAVGGYRELAWPEDYDLWLRFAAAGYALAKVPHVLLSWRHHKSSATFTDARYSEEAFRALKAAHLAARLRDRPVAIWGAGPTGRRFARALEAHGVRACLFVDIDPRKIGRIARGVPIAAPDALGDHAIVVAVGARDARALIRAHLTAHRFVERTDFVCVA